MPQKLLTDFVLKVLFLLERFLVALFLETYWLQSSMNLVRTKELFVFVGTSSTAFDILDIDAMLLHCTLCVFVLLFLLQLMVELNISKSL